MVPVCVAYSINAIDDLFDKESPPYPYKSTFSDEIRWWSKWNTDGDSIYLKPDLGFELYLFQTKS